MNKARKSLSEEVIAMINNNDRFVIDGYDNKIIESVVKNLAEIVSKYIPKTDNRIYGYIGKIIKNNPIYPKFKNLFKVLDYVVA